MAGPEDDGDDDRDPDLDAAERALGTLPRGPESLEEARRRRAWEMRLAPLAGLVAAVAPPDGLFGRILARIGEADLSGALARERRRAARWRGAAIGLGGMVAVAATFLLAVLPGREAGPDLVAVAAGEAGAPALVISLDTDSGRATVRPVALLPQDGQSFELWHIAPGGAPVSLGLVDPAAPVEVAFRAAPGDLAAVSLEPAGGSPTGQPTGPVLYSGPFLSLR